MKLRELAPGTIDVLTIAGGSLRVGSGLLDETFQPETFVAFHAQAGMEIRAARLAIVAGRIVVEGKTTLPVLEQPLPGLANPLLDAEIDVMATFDVPDPLAPEMLGISLRYRLPARWKFSHSFPAVQVFVDDDSRPLNLDRLALEEGFIYLNTHEVRATVAGAEVSLERGLGFVGRWTPGGMLGLLDHPSAAVLLHGPVVVSPDAGPDVPLDLPSLWDARHRVPGIHLQADLPGEVLLPPRSAGALRITKMGVRVFAPLVWPWQRDGTERASSIAYVGDLVLPGSGARLARITAEKRSSSDDRLTLAADFDTLTRERLTAALSQLTGGQDTTRVLPGHAGKDGEGFGLKRAKLALVRQAGGSHEVESASLTFGMSDGIEPWSPLGAPFAALIRIAFESVEVAVVRPFASEHRAVLATITGSTEFLADKPGGGLKLGVSLRYPGFRVSASQEGATTVNLSRFGPQGLRLPDFLDFELAISDIALVAQPGSGCTFSMNLAPGRQWTIGSYAMPRLSLALSCHADPNGASSVDWHVRAGTEAGKPAVPVDQLIRQLGLAFTGFDVPTASLPTAMRSLTIDTVGIARFGQAGRFRFDGSGALALAEGQKLVCSFTIDRDDQPARTHFGGTMQFERPGGVPLTFTLHFDSGGEASGTLVGQASVRIRLRHAIAALASKFGVADVPEIPDCLDVTLESLLLRVDGRTGDLVLGATTEFRSTAVFVMSGKGADRKFAVLVDKHLHLGLSSLPLVGDKLCEAAGGLAGVEDVGIESLQMVVTSGVRDDERDVALINAIIDGAQEGFHGGSLPRLPKPRANGSGASGVWSGKVRLQLGATYFLSDKPQPAIPFAYHAADQATAPDHLPAAAPGPEPQRSQAVWFDVQRGYGPVNVRRLGIACDRGEVRLLLDAAVVLSGLTMELQGLSLAFPVDAIFKLDRSRILESLAANVGRMSTNLDGLALSFESGPISIAGGLLSVNPPPAHTRYAYDGTLRIQASQWAVSAVGSFAQLDSGDSSLFAFGYLNAILGGPAFFFVTGIAAGFGYNRNLTLPTLDALPSFPLIAACTATDDRAAAITSDLASHLYPATGRHWISAGVRFTSFRIIDSFALFTVIFGERVELALMGLSTLTLPPPPKPGTPPRAGVRPYASIAHAQLALQASYAPDEGVLKVAAQLTPESYILSKACHLTGGFALHTWSQDEFARDEQGRPTAALVPGGYRSGDFVLSIGGYHPDFKPPSHYPLVPRAAANWRVSEQLSIKASLYFALTPLAIMTGGTLDASFSSGHFKAWFNTRVDFLLYWEPLAYQARLKLLLGASYHMDWWFTAKTVTAQVSVDLELYGPPFGGKAVVDLYVCSFTIDLGARPATPQKLAWHEFEDRLLPEPSPQRKDEPAVCLSRAKAGLIRAIPPAHSQEPEAWVVDPETFVLVASSVIPCSEDLSVNGAPVTSLGGAMQPFGVRPCAMPKGRLKSRLALEWLDQAGQAVDVAWKVEAVTERLPAALWGAESLPPGQRKDLSLNDFHADQMTAALVTGFTLKPVRMTGAYHTAGIALSRLPMTTRTLYIAEDAWASPVIDRSAVPADADRSEGARYLQLGQVDGTDLVARRQSMRAALSRQGIELSTMPTTRYLRDAADQHALLAAPSLWKLGGMQAS